MPVLHAAEQLQSSAAIPPGLPGRQQQNRRWGTPGTRAPV